MSQSAAWTFMVYIAGDNNLSSAGDNDLREMRRVGSTSDVHIVAQFDNAGELGTRRFHIEKDGIGERVEHLPETDSGSPETLLDFIEWASAEYPAERYALVLWNHGSGWEPSEMDRVARSIGAVNYNEREVTERSSSALRRVFFRSSLERIFQQPRPNERAICSDDGSGHSLDTIELGQVMAGATAKLGRKIDLLGMDACLMSSFEVAYELRDHARFFVASEENEPNTGWPYDRILAALTAQPGMDADALAKRIVHDYIASYQQSGNGVDVTQCALDLSLADELGEPLKALAVALIEHLPAAASDIWGAQRRAAHFWQNTLWDAAHFCLELENRSSLGPVRAAAAELRSALVPGDGRPLVAEGHRGNKVEHCGGLSLYLVPPLIRISPYYRELAFAHDHRWLEMLEGYHAV